MAKVKWSNATLLGNLKNLRTLAGYDLSAETGFGVVKNLIRLESGETTFNRRKDGILALHAKTDDKGKLVPDPDTKRPVWLKEDSQQVATKAINELLDLETEVDIHMEPFDGIRDSPQVPAPSIQRACTFMLTGTPWQSELDTLAKEEKDAEEADAKADDAKPSSNGTTKKTKAKATADA